MKVIMVAVTSKNGFITDGTRPPDEWSSREDREFFQSFKNDYPVFIMGRNTYELIKNDIRDDGRKRIILCENPEAMGTPPPTVTFTNDTPSNIIKMLSSSYDSCLVLGGSSIYTQFLKDGLIDEAYINIEPFEFESGIPLYDKNICDLPDSAIDYQKPLNDKGTIQNHYKLKK